MGGRPVMERPSYGDKRPAARGPRFNPVMNTYERPSTGMHSSAAHAPAKSAGGEVQTMGGMPIRAQAARPAYGDRGPARGGFSSRGGAGAGGPGGKPRRGKSMWIPKKDKSEDRPDIKPKKGPKKFFGNPFGGPVQF